jgi:probable phosphoglycerate mutase
MEATEADMAAATGAAMDTAKVPNIQLYLIRHGETEWSLSGQHTSFTDIPLTSAGRKQAIELKKRLKNIEFQHIFTSPRKRAVETCEKAGFKKRGMIAPDIVEWNYGDYEGLTTKQILAKNPSWDLFDDGAPGGESVEEVSKRADRFLRHLQKLSGKIALFSHGHFSRVIALKWTDLSISAGKRLYLSVGSISILGWDHSRPVIQLWNDTGHLA